MARFLLPFPLLALILGLGLSPRPAAAKNIDLVTLPDRVGVQLTIYNSEDITLVKERRYLTLTRGANRLLFSWANTLIDPSSVELRPLEHADAIEIADTVFPGQKPSFLYWNVDSEIEGQVLVEVSYFTSGLSWAMDYVGVTDPDEERMDFRGYVRVFNRSGEAYENAEIRLIVGTINLVEKIADLARRRGVPVPGPSDPVMMKALRRDAANEAMGLAEAAVAGEFAKEAKGIVKEGLSEYFMFSVQGTETVANGWSKRMQAVHAEDTRFDIVYRMRAHQYGPRPVRFFLWDNDDSHGLGESPLPDGIIRLFRKNGREGLSFLGEQPIRYVPIQAKIEVNLGPDDLVVYETVRAGTERFNFRFNRHDAVSGWDERTAWVDRIRNYRAKPITFEMHRVWPGHIDYESEMETSLFDYRTAVVSFPVEARGVVHYPATLVEHRGKNATQAKIHLHQ